MEVVQMMNDTIIEFTLKPRFGIGAKLWWEEVNEQTGVRKATKVVVVGYRIQSIVRAMNNNVVLQYLVVKAYDDQKEVDVHKYPKGYQFMNEELFEGLIVQEDELFNSEAEIPGPMLN